MIATLSDFATSTADASGGATVAFGPKAPGEVWSIARVKCSSSPATRTPKPVAIVYQGSAGSASPGGTASAGAVGDTVGPSCRLYPGQVITVVFTGCDPGATARVDYTGQRTVPGR